MADTQTQMDSMREDIRAISDAASQALGQLKEHSYEFVRVIIRLDRLSAQHMTFDTRLRHLEEKVGGLDQKVSGLDQKVSGLGDSLGQVRGELAEILRRLPAA